MLSQPRRSGPAAETNLLQLKYKFPANSLPFVEAGPPNLDARVADSGANFILRGNIHLATD